MEVDTLIFDIDDTLYPVDTGFTVHRHQEVIADYMLEVLKFPTLEEGNKMRDEYFGKYHSSFKAFLVADIEGKLPEGVHFEKASLGKYWAEHCDFEKYLTPDLDFIKTMDLLSTKFKMVIFSNGPREYCLKCLDFLQVRRFFADDHVYCVDDVQPACKPEPAAFQKVLDAVGSVATKSVMFEDSMKNIRAAKALGMGTVLITGRGSQADKGKHGDLPDTNDPAVDCALVTVGEMGTKIASLQDGLFPAK